MPKRNDTTPENTHPFEMTIKALRPFIKGYTLADSHRIKIWIQGAFDATELDTIVTMSEGRIQRNHGTLFVDYEELDAEVARRIVARIMDDGEDSIA